MASSVRSAPPHPLLLPHLPLAKGMSRGNSTAWCREERRRCTLGYARLATPLPHRCHATLHHSVPHGTRLHARARAPRRHAQLATSLPRHAASHGPARLHAAPNCTRPCAPGRSRARRPAAGRALAHAAASARGPPSGSRRRRCPSGSMHPLPQRPPRAPRQPSCSCAWTPRAPGPRPTRRPARRRQPRRRVLAGCARRRCRTS